MLRYYNNCAQGCIKVIIVYKIYKFQYVSVHWYDIKYCPNIYGKNLNSGKIWNIALKINWNEFKSLNL